jgi:TRAP transporter TAXI family solute receptor
MKKFIKGSLYAAVSAIIVTAASTDVYSKDRILRADTGSPGGSAHTATVVIGKVLGSRLGFTTQVNDSQTLTRSSLKLGRGQLDWFPMPTAIPFLMQKGVGPYKKEPMKSKAAAQIKNIRGLWGWNANLFHFVTFKVDKIKNFSDLKGKIVYTGPPSGAAAVTSESIIKTLTGFKPNVDYKAKRMPWGGGLQAMMDGKLDVYVRPCPVGCAILDQLGMKNEFRLLDVANAGLLKKWTKHPARISGIIPAGAYGAQVNKDKNIIAAGTTFFIAVNKNNISADLAYKMTKVSWDHLDEIHKSAKTLSSIDKKTPFVGVNVPLHIGAVKYYREVGMKIPARLLPPEAK